MLNENFRLDLFALTINRIIVDSNKIMVEIIRRLTIREEENVVARNQFAMTVFQTNKNTSIRFRPSI